MSAFLLICLVLSQTSTFVGFLGVVVVVVVESCCSKLLLLVLVHRIRTSTLRLKCRDCDINNRHRVNEPPLVVVVVGGGGDVPNHFLVAFCGTYASVFLHMLCTVSQVLVRKYLLDSTDVGVGWSVGLCRQVLSISLSLSLLAVTGILNREHCSLLIG